ncbi:hypothetical protein SAMN04487886_11672 [Clostridium sp. DSM 8431]|uniref:hypothetical protein n=1 Tax=Clostridium sp. DSM 8431 TaxID=1761781 RepID=UPI0008DEC3C7|nr:hypothetical protein [Clostridium sp. DSM 8431]SFU79419.1 hypothetical protein SAMN04487886_11672 [Clostridium sp. DSM 8431]
MNDVVIPYNRRIIKKQKYKRRRAISRIICILLLFTLLLFSLYKLNREIKCRDLQYAVEYELTSGTPSERLLRVRRITLIFNDNECAVIEASGLSKESPHYETKIKGTFKKDKFNSWKLTHIEKT